MRRCIVALLLLGSPACASAPRAVAPTLAYAVPAVNPATYSVADTTTVAVRGGRGRSLDTSLGLAARAVIGMHTDSAGMLASIRLEAVDGTFQAGGAVASQVDSSSVSSGSALLRMGPTGPDSTRYLPNLATALSRFIGGESFYYHFFARLPGGTAAPGTVWTDTLALTDAGGGVESRTETIISASFLGDTIINGRTLRVIASRFTSSVVLSGIVDGMEVSQRLVGTGEATTLWDDAASLMFSREETITSTGTMDLPAAGLRAVPVEARTRRVVRLQQ